ncbi:MAG: class I SAM-dependent methyltransferase [Limisphaerales bacterium]
MSETLYGYSQQQEILPTHGAFKSVADLAPHEQHRRRLFTDKLKLPPALFRGARLLEFGPDAGENSLVFAQWGADCTLAEPNPKAHPVIREYFQRFGLGERLSALEAWDVKSFPEPASDAERFDLVDAEGFIYTIQPTDLWVRKCARLTRPGGFVVLFYYELCGGFLELMLRAVQARHRALTGLDAVASARALFQTKWDSIPHKRRLESWTMDVLENPFVRLKYFLEPGVLCGQMAAAGLWHYSSWPNYEGGLEVHWFKRELPGAERLRQQQDFIRRSRLSHLFGRKHFLPQVEDDFEPRLLALLAGVDGLIDQFSPERAGQLAKELSVLETGLRAAAPLAAHADTEKSLQTVASLRQLLRLLAAGEAATFVRFCNEDRAFIEAWGMPSHFAVFRRAEAGEV